MLHDLYLDFDGVIWDTLPLLNKIIYEADAKLYYRMVNKTLTPEDEVKKRQIYKLANWELILRNSGPLNNSIDWINELHKTGMFNMASLTHCNSTNEALNKG